MRDVACSECVVTMLLGPAPSSIETHRDSLQVLADAGLVAPLRLIKGESKVQTKSEQGHSTASNL